MVMVSRRRALAWGAALSLPGEAVLAATPRNPVAFEVWRGTAKIGEHAVSVARSGRRAVATISAHMRVKIGPVPVFTYTHEATETWEDERFSTLTSRSVSNGKAETVEAHRGDAGVLISHSGGAPTTGAATCAPLTHWNRAALSGPLFNPQTGALVRCRVTPRGAEAIHMANGASATASTFVITGDADITDWYDDTGAWAALKAKGPDGSTIDYRRV